MGWWRKVRQWYTRDREVVSSGELLQQASTQGDLDLVLEILERHRLVDRFHRASALWLAADNGHTQVADALLTKGADPSINFDAASSALLRAAIRARLDIIALLAKHYPQAFYLEFAALALRRAALDGDYATLRALLAGGAPPDLRFDGGATVLMVAAARDAPCAALLLECGARRNAVDADGRTALHHAAHENQLVSARMLLAYGARVFIRDNAGRLAAEEARRLSLKCLFLDHLHQRMTSGGASLPASDPLREDVNERCSFTRLGSS